ncbi:MAG: hypothetical protein R3C56_05395 [Pirellulaceae bacterium]
MDGYALNDIPRSGVENMALDQRLLEVAAAEQCVLLRVYRWSEPTLSLGYFQPYVQRLTHSHSSDLPVVRRATGGGALFTTTIGPTASQCPSNCRSTTRAHERVLA